MKKLLLLTSIILLSLGGNLFASESSIEVRSRLRNTTDLNSENKATDNYFSIERGYLRFDHKFNDNIMARFNVDIFSAGKVVSLVKSVESDSNGVKAENKDVNLAFDGSTVRVKYAFIKFTNIKKTPIKFIFGAIPNIAYTEHFSTFIDYSGSAEKFFKVSSASYGMALGADLMNKKLDANIQLANGTGYKGVEKAKATLYPTISGQISYKPTKAMVVSLLSTFKPNEKTDKDGSKSSDGSSIYFSPSAQINNDYLELSTEFCLENKSLPSDSTTHIGFYIQPGLKLKKLTGIPVTVGGGFAYDKPNTDLDATETRVIAGAKVDLIKNLKLQIAGTKDIDSEDSNNNSSKLMIQFEYKFKDILSK